MDVQPVRPEAAVGPSWRGDVKTHHCVLLGSHDSCELGGGGDTRLKKEKVPPRRTGFHGGKGERRSKV